MTRWWGGGRAALLVAALVPIACGMKTIPLFAGGGGGSGTGTGGSNGLSDGGNSDVPSDGRVIHCSSGSFGQVMASPETPSIIFAVDRSPSMGTKALGSSGTRFTVTRGAISDTVSKYTSLASFGYVEFPGQSNDTSCGNCCAGGFVAPSFNNGPGAILDKMNSCWNPSAGQYNCVGSDATPSATALKKIGSLVNSVVDPVYAILLTDGPPSCSSYPPDICDEAASQVSMMFLSRPSIATAVVAVGDVPIDSDDSGPPANSCLSSIASAGGHPSGMSRPFYYVANTDVLVRSQIDSIVAGTICHVDITDQNVDLNPFRLEVDINGTPIPSDAANGWTLSDARIDFWGTACSTLISQLIRNSHRVVVKGCPLPAPFPSPFPAPAH